VPGERFELPTNGVENLGHGVMMAANSAFLFDEFGTGSV
jgi:hypothetical protein